MKANETVSNSAPDPAGSSTAGSQSSTGINSHAPSFAKVLDGRKQPIRGLWVRNGHYYAQLKIENPITGVKRTKRVPLKDKDGNDVRTVAQAREAMERLRTKRADNDLPILDRAAKFSAYVTHFVSTLNLKQDSDAANEKGKVTQETADKYKAALAGWCEAVGDLRLDQVKRVHVERYMRKRNNEVSNRTVNLDVIALNRLFKKAIAEGIVMRSPTEGLEWLPVVSKERRLFSGADLDKLCNTAFETKQGKDGVPIPLTENAQQFADYIRLMSYCGARRNEALALQWDDVDFDLGQLHVKRQIKPRGITALKGKTHRVVNFNPKLKAHLLDMQVRRVPDSRWLFPSPQRGEKDIPAKSFRESLEMVKARANLPSFGFHDCRHHFISMCVMSGIDFMTIAAWVGHKDGGILIGSVYGHLARIFHS